MYILRWFVLETLFLASITATKSIFYLVGFLAPWFLTKISSKKGKTPRIRGFFLPTCHHISLLPPTCHYLYLPLPAAACHYLPLSHYLQLPVPTCYVLATTSTYHYLPLPATACQCLPLPVSIWPSATTSTGHHLQIPTYPQTLSLRLHRLIWYNRPGCQTNLNRLLLEDPFRQRISSIWFVFLNPLFLGNITSPNCLSKKMAEKVRIFLFLDLFCQLQQGNIYRYRYVYIYIYLFKEIYIYI